MGGETAPARDWFLSIAGHVSDADGGAGATNDIARCAGCGRESSARICDRPIGGATPGAHRKRSRSPPTNRMAKHPARAAAESSNGGSQLRVSPGGAVVPTPVETGTPYRRKTSARARQQHHADLSDFR